MREVLSGNISRYRKDLGLTQEALAEQLSITFQAVSKWETGQTVPDTLLLPKLACALGVSVDKLLGYSAFGSDVSHYEDSYRKDEYFWGVQPSMMCLKILEMMPPTISNSVENGSGRVENRERSNAFSAAARTDLKRIRESPVKILDIGCGEGKDAVFLARCGYDVSAFDISEAGIEKTKRLADKARVNVRTFRANLCDYRLDEGYDVLFSSGTLHYIKPELRDEVMTNYKAYVNDNGLVAFHVFVCKPFIGLPPDDNLSVYFPWKSGQLFTYFHDWVIEHCTEYIFDCNSMGIPHRHAANRLFARKAAGI